MHRRQEETGVYGGRLGPGERKRACRRVQDGLRNTDAADQVSEEGSPGPEPPPPPEHVHVAMSSHTLHVQVH
jgi:hypothetical protein